MSLKDWREFLIEFLVAYFSSSVLAVVHVFLRYPGSWKIGNRLGLYVPTFGNFLSHPMFQGLLVLGTAYMLRSRIKKYYWIASGLLIGSATYSLNLVIRAMYGELTLQAVFSTAFLAGVYSSVLLGVFGQINHKLQIGHKTLLLTKKLQA